MTASAFPPLQSKPSSKRCSNCSAAMTLYALPSHYNNTVDIDVCMDCNAIWFDTRESSMLSPDGTVALFQLINERGGTATSAAAKFGEGLRCVTCGEGMRLTHDRVRDTRFTYQACRHGHGRLTTFYNFLSEKQFVRELTKTERAKLAATVHQVRCSGCGAAVNLGKVDACEYCRAPVAVFDREAAKKAIDHYLQERQKQKTVVITEPRARHTDARWNAYDRAELGSDILYALTRAASRWVAGSGGRAAAGAGAAGASLPGLADSTLETFPDATSALFGPDTAGSVGAAIGDALPNATDALFGAASDAAGEAVSGIGGEIASGAIDAAEEAASSVGESVVDLVTDGIGSLLGSLFD